MTTQQKLTRDWQLGLYTSVLKTLQKTPRDTALELLVVCADDVIPDKRIELLERLGLTSEGDVMALFDL